MKTEEAIHKRIDQFKMDIDKELDRVTDEPVKQWIKVKEMHAMQVALEWVLEPPEG